MVNSMPTRNGIVQTANPYPTDETTATLARGSPLAKKAPWRRQYGRTCQWFRLLERRTAQVGLEIVEVGKIDRS